MNIKATDVLASRMDWAGRNIANNLDFLPDDKLNWKPAPTANSALEIMNHIIPIVLHLSEVIGGGAGQMTIVPVSTREAAQAAIRHATTEYAIQIVKLSDEDLERTVQLPFGETTVLLAAEIAVTDVINHHGQLTYIQTLLGDVESHLEF